jgi:Xaa-Pro aminopeptidase
MDTPGGLTMSMPSVAAPRLDEVALPDFGPPEPAPEIPASTHATRLERLRERMDARGLDRLVIYGDREHSANLAWLTGFDPRFEEAVLIVGLDGDPAILVGNECYGVAGAAPLPMRRVMFQDLSLPSQPRDRSRPLGEILGDEGIGTDSRIGTIGWKTFADRRTIEIPAYLVDELRRRVGAGGLVENANDLLIDAADGLRVVNELEQLAYLEWAARQTSGGLRRLWAGLRIGMTEREAVRLLEWDGTPLSCHLMLTAGPRATLALLSPGDRPIERGDRITTAFGIWGALNCRAGFVVEDEAELPEGIRDYVERLVGPYYAAVAEWYAALHVGQLGGVLDEIVARRLGDPFFGIFLNPGHQIGLDEWVNSPVGPGSRIELRSGMALQVDVIPATGSEYYTTNIEDGIVLADEGLRTALAGAYPAAWDRIGARRRFMGELLGIDLHPDVLPLCDIPAFLPPFVLRPDRAMTLAA